ncbi:MAG TPA: elongation factor G [Actinomycetota bacterium]|jgi:elongation factor G|nr:elongation factor G [Actinomycetota bacterium]
MKTFDPTKIRNIVLLGHQGSGKTTLAEALLYVSGVTTRMGSIAEGNTVCDFEPEEIKKTISVNLALAPFEWKGCKINLLDAPGYADFIGEAQAAVRVADAAVLVVSAVDGIQVQHEALWRLARKAGLPSFVFVNKLERERADFHAILDALSERLGPGFAPLDLPLGEEHDFHGIVDVLSEKAFHYDASGKSVESDMLEETAQEAKVLHTRILDSVAETDDELLEKYLGGEDLTPEEVKAGLHKGVCEGTVFPVLVGSATKLVGLDRLADILVEMAPHPAERGTAVGVKPGTDEPEEREPSVSAPLSAFVFKTISDPYVGRISMFKVISGRLRPDSNVYNAATSADERIAHIFNLRGKHQEPVDEVVAGDIAAVAKLAHTHSGNTLTDKAHPIAYDELEEPDRVLAKAIVPKTKGDEDKLMTALSRLHEEDPALKVDRNSETHQTLIWGTGDTHLDIAMERLSRKYGVDVEEIALRIPYRETIAGPGKAVGRHVKQSGGHGQYAVCNLEIEPLERGAGFEYVDKIFGGSVPSQFIPSVEKGIQKTLTEGAVAGYPVVDVRVTLVDGKFHPVDSSDMAFQIAGSIGFREAVANAGVMLLEPVMDLEVMVPDSYLGDIMGDLNSKRGRIQGTEGVGVGRQLVKAQAPMSEIARYAIDLRSMTGGQGTFRSTFSHYEPVPPHLAEKIIADAKQAKEHKVH